MPRASARSEPQPQTAKLRNTTIQPWCVAQFSAGGRFVAGVWRESSGRSTHSRARGAPNSACFTAQNRRRQVFFRNILNSKGPTNRKTLPHTSDPYGLFDQPSPNEPACCTPYHRVVPQSCRPAVPKTPDEITAPRHLTPRSFRSMAIAMRSLAWFRVAPSRWTNGWWCWRAGVRVGVRPRVPLPTATVTVSRRKPRTGRGVRARHPCLRVGLQRRRRSGCRDPCRSTRSPVRP